MIWYRDEQYKVRTFRYEDDLAEFLNNLNESDTIVTVLNDGAGKFIIVKRGNY